MCFQPSDNKNVPKVQNTFSVKTDYSMFIFSGLCLIINNQHFWNKEYSSREGTAKDAADLTDTWKKLGCEVTTKQNRVRRYF
jgi:hypothetical protein